jgi:hypothetical protein
MANSVSDTGTGPDDVLVVVVSDRADTATMVTMTRRKATTAVRAANVDRDWLRFWVLDWLLDAAPGDAGFEVGGKLSS